MQFKAISKSHDWRLDVRLNNFKGNRGVRHPIRHG